MSSKQLVETYFDPSGTIDGRQWGCFKARLASNHGIWDAGRTLEQAKQEFLKTAGSFGLPNDSSNFCFKCGACEENVLKEIAEVLPWHLNRGGAR